MFIGKDVTSVILSVAGALLAWTLFAAELPEISGVAAGSSVVWIAPREVGKTAQVHRRIMQTLGLQQA